MSNAISVMDGKTLNGPVDLADSGLKGMITLRGDLSSENMAKAVKSAVGLAMPSPLCAKSGVKGSVAWMSPDELLILVDYKSADATVKKIEKALKGDHFMAQNVSDARSYFTLTGKNVLNVVAKGSPANINDLKVLDFRRTRIAQIPVAFWLADEETLHIVCFRSVGEFMFDWLGNAAQNA
jgi:sarcosine oxidase subunit gamma